MKATTERQTNADFAATNTMFRNACEKVPAIKPCGECFQCRRVAFENRKPSSAICMAEHFMPTPRQASKFRRGRGIVYRTMISHK